jgi:hypothetical protein
MRKLRYRFFSVRIPLNAGYLQLYLRTEACAGIIDIADGKGVYSGKAALYNTYIESGQKLSALGSRL